MITAVLMFFKTLFSSLIKFVFGVFTWCIEHPKATAIILACIAALGATFWYTKEWATERTAKKYEKIVQAYVEKEAALQARIKEVEGSTKAEADKTKAAIEEGKRLLAEKSSEYAAKLAEEKKKRKAETIYVSVPGATEKVEVIIDNGEVICQRFPDAFLDVWNGMIDIANKPVEVKP